MTFLIIGFFIVLSSCAYYRPYDYYYNYPYGDYYFDYPYSSFYFSSNYHPYNYYSPYNEYPPYSYSFQPEGVPLKKDQPEGNQ
jgi:hypothetical protein